MKKENQPRSSGDPTLLGLIIPVLTLIALTALALILINNARADGLF